MCKTTTTTKAAIATIAALGCAIRELGQVPSGELYARVMGHMTIENYQSAIDTLVRAKLVERKNSHLLVWVEPTL